MEQILQTIGDTIGDFFENPIVQLQSYLTNFAVTYVTDGTPVLSEELSVKSR